MVTKRIKTETGNVWCFYADRETATKYDPETDAVFPVTTEQVIFLTAHPEAVYRDGQFVLPTETQLSQE